MSISLWDNQQPYLDATLDRLKAGVQRQCWVAPTATGKTVMFCHIPKIHPGRTLICAHTEKLITQAADVFKAVNPNLADPQIEMAGQRASDYAETVIASIPTLGRNGSTRLQRFPKFDNVIIDEAHHLLGQTYINVLEGLGFPCDGSLSAPEGTLLLGVTATPKRTDNQGLDHILQEVVYSRSIRQQIEEGYAVDIVAHRILSGTSLDGISNRMGDFAENELAERVDNDERNHLAVNAYIQHCNGKKAIVFCANVKHVNHVTLLFQRVGIKAESIDGNTPQLFRDAIYYRYKTGQTKVLVNCGVCTEGYDDPTTECVIMLRPTKSQLLYIQMLGRGLRVTCDLTYFVSAEGRLFAIANSSKPRLLVLDIVDVCSKHSPMMLPSLFGLNKDLDSKGEGIFKTLKKLEEAKAKAPSLKIEEISDIGQLQAMTAKALKINIWESGEIADVVKKYSKFVWQQSGDDDYFISLNRGQTMQLIENALGQFEARIETTAVQDSETKEWDHVTPSIEILGRSGTLEEAFHRSDKYITEAYSQIVPLVSQKAKWRGEQAAVGQFEKLKKWRVPVFEAGEKNIPLTAKEKTWLKENRMPEKDYRGEYFWLNPSTGEKELLSKGKAGFLMGQKLEEFNRKRKS